MTEERENNHNERMRVKQDYARTDTDRASDESSGPAIALAVKKKLSAIIKKHRESKFDGTSLEVEVSSFSAKQNLPSKQSKELLQIVRVILDIKNGKSPLLDLKLLKDYLPFDEVSAVVREGVLRGAKVQEDILPNEIDELKELAYMLEDIKKATTLNLKLLNKYFSKENVAMIVEIAVKNGIDSDETVDELKKLSSMIVNTSEKTDSASDVELLTTYFGSKRAEQIHRNALLHGANIAPEKVLAEGADHHLTLFTEVSWGTLGDYYAAVRLIKLLKESNPQLTINWVIKGKKAEIPNELKISKTIAINIVNEWDELFTSKPIIEGLSKTQALFVFPTFHFLKPAQIQSLKDKFNKEFISCLEYSYGTRKDQIGQIELQTGLGHDEMGIFILPHEGRPPLTQIATDQPIIDALFGKQNRVSVALAKDYNDQHHLFFGYVNKELSRVKNKGANVGTFVRLCLEIAQNSPEQKNVDIIVPITQDAFKKLGINYKQYSSVRFIGNNENKVLYSDPSSADKPELRIINLFRFDNHTFQKLVHASHPFKMCTGDQSLSDVISSEHAVIFYQTMAWKQKLTDNYLLIAQEALSAAHLDPKQSIAIEYISLVKELTTQNIYDPASALYASDYAKLKSLLVNPELLKQCQLINRYIIEHKNLNVTLPKYLSSFLSYLKKEERLIGSRELERKEHKHSYERLLNKFIKKSSSLFDEQIMQLTNRMAELSNKQKMPYLLFTSGFGTQNLKQLEKQRDALNALNTLVMQKINELKKNSTPTSKEIGQCFKSVIATADRTRKILKANRSCIQALIDWVKNFANFCIKMLTAGQVPHYFNTTTKAVHIVNREIDKIKESLDDFVEKTDEELKAKQPSTGNKM